MNIKTIIFDLGNVLINWEPEHLYRKIFQSEEEMQYFLTHVCTSEWNVQQDAGRLLRDATKLLVTEHPQYQKEIEAFYGRWTEMLGGSIAGTVEILKELKMGQKYRLYALTNWSAETFPFAIERYDFLQWFEGIVVSGDEKMIKPQAEFYQIILDRYDIDPSTAVFIDDSLKNVEGAKKVGMEAIHFQSPEQLRKDLQDLGVVL